MSASFDSIWSPAKVFSPTTTRAANASAKDWSHIEHFLSRLYSPSPIPPFERNPETLKALLALAAANESADEEHMLERKVKERCLEEMVRGERDEEEKRRERGGGDLVEAVDEALSDQGRSSLNCVALLSVALGGVGTEPGRLGSHIVELSKQEFAVEQQTQRIEALSQKLQADINGLRDELRRLETAEEFKLPEKIDARITEWTRNTRVLEAKLENYKDKIEESEARFSASRISEGLTVPALVQHEKEVLALKEEVLRLEAQAKGYRGLPSDVDLARLEVERVEAELEALEAERERLYDGMLGK